MIPEINLGLWQERRVFSGRESGEQAREWYNLDELDLSTTPVIVLVPDDTLAITTSFFHGLFAKSVDLLGEGIREQYKFSGGRPGLLIDRHFDDLLFQKRMFGYAGLYPIDTG